MDNINKQVIGIIADDWNKQRPKQFLGYGGISSKDIQNFKIPQFGTLKLDAEEIKPTKLIQSVNVKVEFEHYKEPVIELNENNEVVVKVGKIQIGGCK